MPDGIKVSVWYSEEGVSFCRGNGARKKPEKVLSWDEAAGGIELLYTKGQFATKEVADKALDIVRRKIAGEVFLFYREETGQYRWGTSYEEASTQIAKELKEPTNVKKLYGEILAYGNSTSIATRWQQRRYEKITGMLQKLESVSPLIPQGGKDPVPTVFITSDEIDNLLPGRRYHRRRKRKDTFFLPTRACPG